MEFFLLDPAKTAALMLCDREQYGQGKHILDEYINSFQALVEQATYPNSLQLYLTFWDGLHPMLVEHIDNLMEGHPDNKRIASWYEVAWDQWQLMEIQRELCHPHPALCPASVNSLYHLIPAHPMPAPTPAIPEELLLKLLAMKDAARALLPDKLTPELTPEEISTCTSPLELEEGF
ncbi:hypothetical protein C0989_008949 [Termitomyces sp. Mn162]|nr:hypothetical protein C0989_008949 [Termitomyces sp. Mn162]